MKKYFVPIVALLFILTSCGLAEHRAKKQRLEEAFKIYPTQEGDVAVEENIVIRFGGEIDSAIIVQNGEKYFRIKKDGTRVEVKRVSIRR